MSANNIMSRFQPMRDAAPVPTPSTPTQCTPVFWANHLHHADLSANMKDMVHYPNTPEGQTAYQAQVLMWKTTNPHEYKGGDEYAPYPLMPGTLSVGVVKHQEVLEGSIDRKNAIPKALEAALGEGGRPHMDMSSNTSMYDTNIIDIFDVYSVGEEGNAIPFEKEMNIIEVNGELVVLKATFDDCAMVNVIDKVAFKEVKNQLSEP
ncbi:hypothetical protein PILCRDRAFT_8701 [Piloderma croceum F 1598]|uniref:Uncharacterized protein n=1 Tax=Piloderma croceum (strain F 1598) TaxID=765440 RepID=A0A0C3B522_PILCF|nr:hypothetical protein PILCRDRAFT_8701 [Piloderma croceum F 1598]